MREKSVKFVRKLIEVVEIWEKRGCRRNPSGWSLAKCMRRLLHFIFQVLVTETINFCQGKFREFFIQKRARTMCISMAQNDKKRTTWGSRKMVSELK